MDALTLVTDFLHSLQQQGVMRLPVDEEARGILRSWMIAAKRGGRVASARPAAAPQQEPLSSPATVPPPFPAAEPAAQAAPSAADTLVSSLREGIPDLTQEQNKGEEMPELFFRPGGATEDERWEMARRLLPRWEPLQQLGSLRPTAVWGTGDRHAGIMFVGDAPGYHDEREARPFCGEAGGKLDGMLKAMGLERGQVYLTHLVKFRPSQPRQTINTRPPTERECALSLPVLDWEIGMVRPRVIVALGVIAARGLLGGGNLPLAAYQQRHGQFKGIPVVVTHHPSYLLRTGDLGERRRLWEEMLAVMEMAGLPINERQRSYFLPKRG